MKYDAIDSGMTYALTSCNMEIDFVYSCLKTLCKWLFKIFIQTLSVCNEFFTICWKQRHETLSLLSGTKCVFSQSVLWKDVFHTLSVTRKRTTPDDTLFWVPSLKGDRCRNIRTVLCEISSKCEKLYDIASHYIQMSGKSLQWTAKPEGFFICGRKRPPKNY